MSETKELLNQVRREQLREVVTECSTSVRRLRRRGSGRSSRRSKSSWP